MELADIKEKLSALEERIEATEELLNKDKATIKYLSGYVAGIEFLRNSGLG